MEEILIRPTRPEDAEALIAHTVAIASEPGIFVSFTPEEADLSLERQIDAINKDFALGNLWLVAEHAGRIVADFGCRIEHAFTITRHTAELGMSVDRCYRNRGIGARLMERGVDWALKNGIVRLELEVYSENAPAIHLYTKFGFEVEGRKRMYAFQRGRYFDALVMSRLFI
jgi:putative acetyltransferase